MNVTNFFNFAQGLASVQRFSSHRLANRESVLEHIGFVANMALIIGLELDLTTDDMATLLTRAIVHDWEEEQTGDILRPVKHSSSEMLAMFDKMKPAAMTKIFNNIETNTDTTALLSASHTNAKYGRIGFLVDLCDKAAVVYKIYDEVILRNNLTMVNQAKRNITNMRKLEDTLRADKVEWFNTNQTMYLLQLIANMMHICRDAASLERNNMGAGTVS